MNILIFGSEGFIGSHLVKHFLRSEQEVTGCDLLPTPSQKYIYHKVSRLVPEYDEIFQQQSYDICINASGNGNVPYSMTHPFNDFEANCVDCIRMLDGLRRHHPACKYIYISSAAVYGNPEKLPVQEGDRLLPLSPYGWHKLMAENLCREYNQLFELPTISIRPFSVYGDGLKKQLFWDLYQHFRSGLPSIELWGTGNESRDFIFIDDLVKCVDLLISNADMKGEAYNVASGIEMTIKEVTDLFFQSMKPSIQVRFNNKVRAGDPLNWRADITKLKALGFTPATDINQGIKTLSEWMNSLN